MDEETSAEGKERQRKALQSFAKEFGRVYDSNEREGRPKKELVHFHLLWVWRKKKEGWRMKQECVGTGRSRSAERCSREWRTNYSSRRSQRIWDYLFKKRRSCSQAHYKRYIIPFFLAVLLIDLHHNGDAFQEDHMGLRRMNSQEKIPLYTRLGTVTTEIHLSVYHQESSNNERWKLLLFELPWRATPSRIAPGVSWIRWLTCVRWWRRGRGASSGGQRFRANYIWSWKE